MTEEPASLILELLRQIRAEAVTKPTSRRLRAELASKDELRSEMHSLRADVASDICHPQGINKKKCWPH